ncbi:MAG: SDR family NAD(P)-dependent oxidoreductase, partial [Pseudomonadota bacterium]
MLLENRVVFVTGGGSGIGRAGAMAMAAQGAVVVVSDLSGARADRVTAEITQLGGQAQALALDVTD